MTEQLSPRVLRISTLAVLLPLSLVSVVQGLRNASHYSQDMQWSPTRLLLTGRNPYEIYLAGDPGGEILYSQAPNYLHALYVVLLPLGALEFDVAKFAWAACNLALGVTVCLFVSRSFKLDRNRSLILLLLFLISTPFRNVIGNGQQAIFVLFFLLLPFLVQGRFAWLFQGLGYVKYSFAPSFFLFCLFRKGLLPAALSTILPIAGFLVFLVLFDDGFVTILFQPLLVASNTVGVGWGDLMSLLERVLPASGFSTVAVYGIPLAISVLGAYLAARFADLHHGLVIVSLVSLIAFKHLGYDWVFLLPVAALALRDFAMLHGKLAVAYVLYVWCGVRLFDFLAARTLESYPKDAMIAVNFVLSVAFLLYLFRALRALENDPCLALGDLARVEVGAEPVRTRRRKR